MIRPLLVLTALAACGPSQREAPVAAPAPNRAPASATEPAPPAPEIDWLTDEAAALQRARGTGRGLLVDFRADWCQPCVELEEHTFADPRVAELISASFVPLRFDITNQDDRTAALMESYRVNGLPAVLIVTPDRREIARVRTFVPADELLPKLRAARDQLYPTIETN